MAQLSDKRKKHAKNRRHRREVARRELIWLIVDEFDGGLMQR